MTPTQLHPIARMPSEWASLLASRKERSFRALEIFRWIHKRAELDASKMTTLPPALRADVLAELASAGTVEHVHRAQDGTRKVLVRLHDGPTIETVLLPRVSGFGSAGQRLHQGARDASGAPTEADADADDDEDDDEDTAEGASAPRLPQTRVTQCISTQVGCAMGCVFCASGVAGLKRNLAPEEIVAQVLLAKRSLDPDESLRAVVYMGMGEPLHNYAATKRSLELLTHPEGVGLSRRRVTVSTSGLIPEMLQLGEDFEGQIGLAVSLHAAEDEQRRAIMPIDKKYPLPDLIAALERYPLPKRRRITIEYTLLAGHNDRAEDAKRLSSLLSKLRVKINLIPMNPIQGSDFASPSWDRVFAFQSILTAAGYSCFIRRQRGDDVSAACGQLALLGAKPKIRRLPTR